VTETETLAELTSSTSFDDLSAPAVEQAKQSLRDIVGLTINGSTHRNGRAVASYLSTVGATGNATVVGHGDADPPRAALANGTFGHTLNYDDTFESVVIHPSCTAFPAALAAGEAVDATGRDLVTAYVVGLEVTYRIGRSVAPTHWHHGWHSTATIGIFGATAAAASLYDLSTAEVRRALGIAGSFSSGLKKNIGTMTNPIHCGHAAQKGLEAVLLVRADADADDSILEGQYGYGTVMTIDDTYNPERIHETDHEWAVLDNAFKPYPSGVVTHSAMEALRAILERADLGPDDVETITATVDERVMDTIDQHDPQNAAEANVSYEFCLAVMLRERDAGIHEFTDEYVRAPETREAMAKVELDPREDPFDATGDEASYGARIAVETVDGRTLTNEMLTAPGGPSNPLPEERWRGKFYECAETALDRDTAEAVEASILELDADGALSDLLAGLRSA
jgi:2-methylcitrate dehydratase PrpD